MDRYRFWIHDKDENGLPLDPQIMRAAEEILDALAKYREEEIQDESAINTMLQSAVEAASKANRNNRIRNPAGYIVKVYHRIVDHFLDEERRCISVDDVVLEKLANAALAPKDSERAIHNQLILRKLMDAMDEETRKVCDWRLQGVSMNKIAKHLGVPRPLLSKRYGRGVKKAEAKILGQGKPGKS